MYKYVINSMWFFFSVNACHPTLENDKATFRLNLQDIYQCMVTKVVNKETVRLFHYSEKLVLIILDKMTRQNDSKFALFWNFKFENQEIIFGTFYTFNLATSLIFFFTGTHSLLSPHYYRVWNSTQRSLSSQMWYV